MSIGCVEEVVKYEGHGGDNARGSEGSGTREHFERALFLVIVFDLVLSFGSSNQGFSVGRPS
jgi:hypothetical protein